MMSDSTPMPYTITVGPVVSIGGVRYVPITDVEVLEAEIARLRVWLERIKQGGNLHPGWLVDDATRALAGETLGAH